MAQRKSAAKRERVWQQGFLSALAKTGNVTTACAAVGKDRALVYRYRLENSEFADAWTRAMAEAADNLEKIAWERASTGSDTLLIFLLKGLRPEKYREHYRHEHTGPHGGPIQVQPRPDLSNLTDEELRSLNNILSKVHGAPQIAE